MESTRTREAFGAGQVSPTHKKRLDGMDSPYAASERMRKCVSHHSAVVRHPELTCVIGLAITFSSRLESSFLLSVFHMWRKVYTTHGNAWRFSIQYHSSRLQYNLLLTWRIQLRRKMKAAKEARAADRFFATRRAWKKMVAAFKARGREKKLQDFAKRQLDKHFRGDHEKPQ
jgi:hypothetical protein